MKNKRSIRYEHADILLTDPSNTQRLEFFDESDQNGMDLDAEALFECMYCVFRGRLEDFDKDSELFQPENAWQVFKIYSGSIAVYGPSDTMEDLQEILENMNEEGFAAIIEDFTGTVSCVADEYGDIHVVGISDDGAHDFFTIEYHYDAKSIQLVKESRKQLVLTNGKSDVKCDKPLNVENASEDVSSWAKIAAYVGGVKLRYGNEKPEVGDVMDFIVHYPVSCKVGEAFVAYGELKYWCWDPSDKFIKMKLLEIKRHLGAMAIVMVEILEKGNMLSFVKPVPEEEKHRLKEQREYNYVLPKGDGEAVYYNYASNIMQYSNSLWCGDYEYYDDFIFTDQDGIDHLVQSFRRGIGCKEAYFGDKVIGYHQYSPYTRIKKVQVLKL